LRERGADGGGVVKDTVGRLLFCFSTCRIDMYHIIHLVVPDSFFFLTSITSGLALDPKHSPFQRPSFYQYLPSPNTEVTPPSMYATIPSQRHHCTNVPRVNSTMSLLQETTLPICNWAYLSIGSVRW
jgi:hypothetical protein